MTGKIVLSVFPYPLQVFPKFKCSQISTLKEAFYPDKTILQYRENEMIAYSREKGDQLFYAGKDLNSY